MKGQRNSWKQSVNGHPMGDDRASIYNIYFSDRYGFDLSRGDPKLHLFFKDAVIADNVQLATQLLEDSKGKWDVNDIYVKFPKKIICCVRSVEMLHLLIKHGGDVNCTKITYNQTPLIYAIRRENQNHKRIMRMTKLDNLNSYSERKISKFFPTPSEKEYCDYIVKDEELVKALLENGADPNIFVHCSSPNLVSCTRNKKIVDLLLKFGFNVNNDKHGESPLMNVLLRKLDINIVKSLLEYGANPNYTNIYRGQWSPIFLSGSSKIVHLLIWYGADINYSCDTLYRNNKTLVESYGPIILELINYMVLSPKGTELLRFLTIDQWNNGKLFYDSLVNRIEVETTIIRLCYNIANIYSMCTEPYKYSYNELCYTLNILNDVENRIIGLALVDLYILRLKMIKYKRDLLQKLCRLTIIVERCGENGEETIQLDYDCVYYIAERFLNSGQIYKLFFVSMMN